MAFRTARYNLAETRYLRPAVLPFALLGLQMRPEIAQRTDWAGDLPFKLCDVPFKGRLECHCKVRIFLAMGVLLD